jgi:methionyl-tRNA formyltransferase
MRIVLWIGNEPNQKALANKLHSVVPISGIVTETRKRKSKITFPKVIEKIIEKLFLRAISRSWFDMQNNYAIRYPVYPDTRLLNVENINAEAAYDFTKGLTPDLIVVSGTSLIKKKMLSIQPIIGIVNLHTGLSPYIKGGPNCTNWCIATNQFHLIGNTVMWIDAGIDTGNIIATEGTVFTGKESFAEVHVKVMEHAHDLYIRCVQKLISGARISIPQHTIAQGKTYYTKQWNLKQKIKLIKNFSHFEEEVNSARYNQLRDEIKTITLEGTYL